MKSIGHLNQKTSEQGPSVPKDVIKRDVTLAGKEPITLAQQAENDTRTAVEQNFPGFIKRSR